MKKYQIIYADPAWQYGCKECNGTGIIEEDGLYTISDSLGSHTFFHTYPSKCPVCKGKGYIV